MERSIKLSFIGILCHCFLIPLYGVEKINEVDQTNDSKIEVSIEDKIPYLKKYVQEARQLWEVPGVSVAIFEKGHVYYINDGVTKIGTNTPFTENSVFCVMSCTKIVTAILLHQLEDEGLINLNDPVTKYLPWFKLSDPEATRKTQIHHLISHCIGLPNFAGDTLWYLGFSQKEIIKKLALIPMKYQPGEKYAYQNICFGIAGMLIEEVLKKPFSEIVHERIFQKLDMHDSSVGKQKATLWSCLLQKLKKSSNSSSSSTNSQELATAHTKLNNNIVPFDASNYPYLWLGTAGINSTTSDYIKLISCVTNKGIIQFGPHKGQRLFSEKAWKIMSTPNIPVKGYKADPQFPVERIIENNFHYGQGMYKILYGDNSRKASIYYHMGAGTGWRTLWLIIPSAQIGIVVFSNLGSLSTSLLPEVIAFKIFDLYLQLKEYDWNQEKYKQHTRVKQSQRDYYQLISPQPISFSALSGTYHSDLYGDLKISSSKSKDGLFLSYQNKQVKLNHISGLNFSLRPSQLSFQYHDDETFFFEGSDNGIICGSSSAFREDTFKKVK